MRHANRVAACGLQGLHRLSCAVQAHGRRAMLVLAAAVSDFYVPWSRLPEHKIQSAGGALTLDLVSVPKCLGRLCNEWAPDAFHVSFKLETDERILYKKARAAIVKYGVDVVVANLLRTRKDRCVQGLAALLAPTFAACLRALCVSRVPFPAACGPTSKRSDRQHAP